jgi:spore maturation protein CgeD
MVLLSKPEPPKKGKVSVFLPSFNKGGYALDAMRSVFAQTRTDWELFVLENSNDGETTGMVLDEIGRQPVHIREQVTFERLHGQEIERKRRETYITAWLLNVYYPEAAGDYIFYLSDDDLIDPDCFEVMAGELDTHPSYDVVYCGLRHYTPKHPGDNGPAPDVGIAALDPKMFPGSVDSRIDGGQIMHRKTCLDALVYPYFEESTVNNVARHADGIFMERLVGRFPFWPIDRYLVTHRWTNLSVWSPHL